MIKTFPILLFCVLTTGLAAPATALDTTRPDVQEFMDEMVRYHDFAPDALAQLLAGAEKKQAILDAISRPAERVVPWHEYRARFVNEKRILQGAEFWRTHAKRLTAIKDDDIAATVAGILGVETSYGRNTGRYRVLDALTTLAFDYPPRGDFFRGELHEFLLLAREEKVDPLTALGSYAGAMGAPQFIASSYRNFAVDGDTDGHRDLWSNWDDVIGSVANYLREHGWRDGEPIVTGATLAEAQADGLDPSRLELTETVQSLRTKGVQFETTLPLTAPAMLITAQGSEGPVYRVGFNNFYVITRYNRSSKYAMAVHDLGQAIMALTQHAHEQ